MPVALSSLPFRASAFAMVSAIFGVGIVTLTHVKPQTPPVYGDAHTIDVMLFTAGSVADPAPTRVAPAEKPDRSAPATARAAAPQPVSAQAASSEMQTSRTQILPLAPSASSSPAAQGEPGPTPARESGTAPMAETGVVSRGGARETPAQGAPALVNIRRGERTGADTYDAQVIRWIERHKRHPGRVNGLVTVKLTVDRRGRLLSSQVTHGSGDTALDRIAMDQLRAAAPFPRPSSDVVWRTREITVRLDYRRA